MKDDKIETISLKDNDNYKAMTLDEVIDTFFNDIFNIEVDNEEEAFWKKLEKTMSK